MKTKTLKTALSIFVAFSLILNSCDKKNASIVNRRIVTPEEIEEIKEAQRAKARQEDSSFIKGLQADEYHDDEIRVLMKL